jgi:hypothetical protein
MIVTEACIAEVVEDAGREMHDPQYITGRVDRLMGEQPAVARYVVSHQRELGVEGVVSALFHVAIIHESVVRAKGRQPDRLSYAELDTAAHATPTAEVLARTEPNIAAYIASNVESPVARDLLAQVGAALVSLG